ncbi:hypothetical protein GGR21_000222 [Dysgonomonas hofstadii]|uniref:DUF5004 domain-containing protein n=1 Tax=Dysgonomonas hofstadii TaxID=637886 RepID=A0A840CEC9_9BACT|nr:DUF5004 domain-containing protein [Dysgonomonas hofstadii]MBB4034337.1 hypothetical protein [Dysgonomonas hofstadii]
MKIISYIKMIIVTLMLVCVSSSCDDFKDQSPTIQGESIKDISGSWKIVKASRNSVDITSSFDFSKFRLNINQDNTYSIDDYLPFLVRDNGTWNTDDAHFPFKLSFQEANAPEPIVSILNYPVSEGKRVIKLTFTPGCHSNSYTYELERVSN